MEADCCPTIEGRGQRGITADDELMAAGIVFVPVIPTCSLPTTAQVVEVRFVKLAGVGHCGIVSRHVPIPLGISAVVPKNAFGLSAQGLVMEQVVVLAQAEKFHPRTKLGFIDGEAPIGMTAAEAEYIAGKIAQAAVLAHQFDIQQLALHLLEGNASIVGQQLDREFEIPGKAFRCIDLVGYEPGGWRIIVGEGQAQDTVVLPTVHEVMNGATRMGHTWQVSW